MIRPLVAASLVSALSAFPAFACDTEVTRFRKVVESDAKVGHLDKKVYPKVDADLKKAEALCKAGQSGPALSALSATKSRYGYP